MSPLEELFQRIGSAKAQLYAMRPLDREREQRLMQKFRLWWTYHSNAIEGNSLTQGETEMFLMEGLTAKGKSQAKRTSTRRRRKRRRKCKN